MATNASIANSNARRQEWLKNIMASAPNNLAPYSKILKLSDKVRPFVEKAESWFFDPTDEIDARFGIVADNDSSIYWFQLTTDYLQGHDFRALNGLLMNNVPYLKPEDECFGEEIQSPVETEDEDTPLILEESPAQEVTTPSEEPIYQGLEIKGRPQVDLNDIYRKPNKPEDSLGDSLYDDERIDYRRTKSYVSPARSSTLASMIDLIEQVFNRIDTRLSNRATAAFIAHSASLLNKRLAYCVCTESQNFEESDLTKLYLALSSRYTHIIDQGAIPLHALDDFIEHRQNTLIEFFKSLQIYVADYKEPQLNRHKPAETSNRRPIPRVILNSHRRDRSRFGDSRNDDSLDYAGDGQFDSYDRNYRR